MGDSALGERQEVVVIDPASATGEDTNGSNVASPGQFTIKGWLKSLIEVFTGGTGSIKIRDKDNSAYQASITSDGRLKVAQDLPVAPPNTTAIELKVDSTVASTTDSFFTITNTKTLTLQTFQSGSELATSGGGRTELYYAPNGNTTGIVKIGISIFTNGVTSPAQPLNQSFLGNGTRAILIRRTNTAGGSLQMEAVVLGYEA